MKIRTFLLALLLLFSPIVSASYQDETFYPPNHSFSVTMPHQPMCRSELVAILGEDIEIHMCVYANVSAQMFYSVTFFNRPKSSFAVDDKSALRGAVEGALIMSNSRLVSQREVTVDGYLGLECVMKAIDVNILATTRYVLTKQEFVFVNISGKPDRMSEEVVRTFLDSLRFTEGSSSRSPGKLRTEGNIRNKAKPQMD